MMGVEMLQLLILKGGLSSAGGNQVITYKEACEPIAENNQEKKNQSQP